MIKTAAEQFSAAANLFIGPRNGGLPLVDNKISLVGKTGKRGVRKRVGIEAFDFAVLWKLFVKSSNLLLTVTVKTVQQSRALMSEAMSLMPSLSVMGLTTNSGEAEITRSSGRRFSKYHGQIHDSCSSQYILSSSSRFGRYFINLNALSLSRSFGISFSRYSRPRQAMIGRQRRKMSGCLFADHFTKVTEESG